jgi:hypothetical protein
MECPKCFNEGRLEVKKIGNHSYLYCLHIIKEGGKTRKKRCYLGAAQYTYVERFNPLGLTGLHDKERFVRYARKLLDNLSPQQLEWLKEALHRKIGEVMKIVQQGEGG